MGAGAWGAVTTRPWRALVSRWPWLALLYLVGSAVLALLLLPIVAASLLLLPFWGILLGALERRRFAVLGLPIAPTPHVPVSPEQGREWLSVRLGESATWREVIALLADLGLGLVFLAVLAAEAAIVAGLAILPLFTPPGDTLRIGVGPVAVAGGPEIALVTLPLSFVFLGAFGFLNLVLASLQANVLSALYAPRQQDLEQSVERLVDSRAALVEGFASERRRIERDLHDGVQQELVALGARLAVASLELDELEERGADVAGARSALDSARDQTDLTMTTLRNTVRGIHPSALTDLGLRAALEELAERTPMPLSVDLAGFDRLPPSVETAAYYLATEGMTNAVKHAAATRVTVWAGMWDDVVEVEVTDDGRGGADPAGGSGLRGLRERAESLGGDLVVESPDGGGTRLRMRLPVALPARGSRASTAR